MGDRADAGTGRRDRSAGSGRSAGFTLVELLVTLAVIGVLGTAALGVYNRYSRSVTADRAAAVVAQDVYRTRSYAIQRREPVSLVIDESARIYRIRPAGGPLLARQVLDESSDLPLTSITLRGADSVTFNARGLLTSSSLEIDLARLGAERRVDINALGRTRVRTP